MQPYVFNTRIQHDGETFDSFLTSLKTLASSCEFGLGELHDALVRDHIIIGMNNAAIRIDNVCFANRICRSLLVRPSASIIHAANAASSQADEIKAHASSSVNYVPTADFTITSLSAHATASG